MYKPVSCFFMLFFYYKYFVLYVLPKAFLLLIAYLCVSCASKSEHRMIYFDWSLSIE